MTKRRASIDPAQLGFTFDPPVLPGVEAGLARLDRFIAGLVAQALKEDPRDRYEIAAAMSRILDEDVSKSMLDKYASEASEEHNIPAHRALALVRVTERFDLFDLAVRRIGAALLVGEEIITAELGQIDRQMAQLKARRRSIEGAAPVIKRGRNA